MRIHLDTDFAGDTDDAAALVMLLGWPGADIVGITTVADPDGRRAGYVHHLLGLAGRQEIPVAAGAGVSLTTGASMGTLPDHQRYWGDELVAPRPSPAGAALELLAHSVEAGAVVVGIGPSTNLALLEDARPGSLSHARVVLMGGWFRAPDDGLPAWGPEVDWNVQSDVEAVLTVFQAAGLMTLVTLPATLHAHLRGAHLPELEASGQLGRLLARQARAHAEDHRMVELGRSYAALSDDLLNFQYDPFACAVALSSAGATLVPVRLRPVLDHDILRFDEAHDGQPVQVVTDVDNDTFARAWLRAVSRADHRAQYQAGPTAAGGGPPISFGLHRPPAGSNLVR